MPMHTIIQQQRKALGLTQEQVARCLNVSTAAVSKWENGLTSPDVGLLPPLARLLKVDMNALFEFHETLSRQEIGLFCNQLAGKAPEEAFALALEQALFQAGTRTQLLLSRLVDAELACGDADAARSVAETSQAIAQALELWPYNQYTALWQVAVHNRDAQEALTRLEQMLEALEQPWQLGDTVLYRRMAPQAKPFQPGELRALLLQQLEQNPDLIWLRELPRAQALLQRIHP